MWQGAAFRNVAAYACKFKAVARDAFSPARPSGSTFFGHGETADRAGAPSAPRLGAARIGDPGVRSRPCSRRRGLAGPAEQILRFREARRGAISRRVIVDGDERNAGYFDKPIGASNGGVWLIYRSIFLYAFPVAARRLWRNGANRARSTVTPVSSVNPGRLCGIRPLLAPRKKNARPVAARAATGQAPSPRQPNRSPS